MKLEDQVVSLDLAKKLKELGVRQESVFYWGWFPKYEQGIPEGKGILYFSYNHEEQLEAQEIASAFTVAELGQLLPVYVKVEIGTFYLYETITGEDGFRIFDIEYREWEKKPVLFSARAQFNEADARAAMLVYLIEKGIVDVKKLSV